MITTIKCVIAQAPMLIIKNSVLVLIGSVENKPERLSLASFFGLDKYLLATQVVQESCNSVGYFKVLHSMVQVPSVNILNLFTTVKNTYLMVRLRDNFGLVRQKLNREDAFDQKLWHCQHGKCIAAHYGSIS
jgi:hypothetical protein